MLFRSDDEMLTYWAEDKFETLYEIDYMKYQSMSRLDAHHQMFLDAQGIDADWDEFLIATGKTETDFDQLWGKWDEMKSTVDLKQDIRGLFNLDVEPLEPEIPELVDNVALKTRGSGIKPFVPEVVQPPPGPDFQHLDPFAEPVEFTPADTRVAVTYTPEEKMEFLYRYAQVNDIDLKKIIATDGSDMFLNVDSPLLDFFSPKIDRKSVV